MRRERGSRVEAHSGLLDKIRSVGTGGLSSDDPQAVEKLEAKLATLEKHRR